MKFNLPNKNHKMKRTIPTNIALLFQFLSIFILLSIGNTLHAQESNTLLISDASAREHLANYLQVFQDPSHKKTIDNVDSSDLDFINLNGKTTLGFTRDAVWSKLRVKNDTDKSTWYLQHTYPSTYDLHFFIKDANGHWLEQHAHWQEDINSRSIPIPLMTFHFNIKPGEEKVIFLRHETATMINFNFKIMSESEFFSQTRSKSFYNAFFYASLFIIALINILLSFNPNAKHYLYISAYCLSFIAAYSIYEGYFQIFSGFSLGKYATPMLNAAVGYAIVSLLSYFRHLIPDLKKYRLHRIIFTTLVSFWLFIPLAAFFETLSIHQFKFLAIGYISSASYVLFISLNAFIKGHLRSNYLVFGTFIFSIFFILQGLHCLGLIEGFTYIGESIRIGILVLSLCMTLTMQDYVNELQKIINRSCSKFKNVFNNQIDGICIIDTDYNIIEINDAAAKIESVSAETLKGTNLLSFTSVLASNLENKTKLSLALEKALMGKANQADFLIQSDNQENQHLNISFSLFDYENDDKYILLSSRNLSDVNRYQTQIEVISSALSGNTGYKFLQELVIKISEITGFTYAMITSLDFTNNSASALAISKNGIIKDNFEYNLTGTPCYETIQSDFCIYEDAVDSLFPEDLMLREEGIKSYIGMLLRSSSGEAIGILALMNCSAVKKQNKDEVLSIFSSRAATELERLKFENNLTIAQQRLSLHIDNTHLGVIEMNNDLTIMQWNRAAERIFGFYSHEIIGKSATESIFKYFTNSDLGKLLLNKKTLQSNVYPHITKDNKTIFCSWNITPLLGNNEELGYAALVEDITVQQETYISLIEKEYDQTEILNSMADAAITIDEQGIILTFNFSAESLFGYSEQEILGQKINLLMPSSVGDHHDSYLSNYLKTGNASTIGNGREVEGLNKQGNTFPMHLFISELPKLKSGLRRFIATCHKLTLLKEKENQLMQRQKLESLGKITCGIAHDFNNILGIISGYSGLLSASLYEDADIKYLREIEHATDRGVIITKKLLSLSKHEPIKTVTVSLNEIVTNLQDIFCKAMTPGILTKFDLCDAECSIDIDVSSFQDAILNLSINAMHAMKGSGVLNISTIQSVSITEFEPGFLDLKPGEYHLLCIKDNGEGIPKSIIRKIFDPFFSTKGDKGTGLGLSQVYAFMQQHQGYIKVISNKMKGTEFVLYFPAGKKIAQDNLGSIPEETSSANLSGTEQILLIDDEPHLIKTISQTLKSYGYKVISTTSPNEAMQLVHVHEFDLILSDIVMPECNGITLIKRIQVIRPTIKFQLMSGFISEASNEVLKSLKHTVLPKPFKTKELLIKIRSILDINDNIPPNGA
jgi:PAS domain S-box-containing protein